MKLYIKYILALFIIMAVSGTYAANKDSLKLKKDSFIVNYFYKKNLDTSFTPHSVKINTSLTCIQIYNPVYEHNFFPLTLGNMGLAAKSLVFRPYEKMGFDIGMHSFDDYLFTDDNIKYYSVRTPYTELSTVLGAKKEQMIEIKHYQNIKKQFNIGLDYRVIGSLSEYSRERADLSNFRFSGSYFSKNKKYYTLANFITNRIKAQENGGILSVIGSGAQSLDSMNLNNSVTHLRETEINLKQYFRLGRKQLPPVTMLPGDSTKQKEVSSQQTNTFDLGYIAYSFSYSRQFQTYTDLSVNKNFYERAFYDSTAARDSIIARKFINTISWSPSINSKKDGRNIIAFFFNLSSESIDIFNKYDRRRYYMNILPSAGFATGSDGRFRFIFNSEYSSGDYNKSDYKLNAAIELKFNKKSDTINKLILSGYLLHKTPERTSDYYLSDFFQWNNNFKSPTTTNFSISYLYKKLNIGFRYYTLQDYIFFNSSAKPQQADKSFSTYSAYIYKSVKLGSFELMNKMVYQSVSNEDYLHLPEFTIYESAYFNFELFKKAMKVQGGVDFWFSSDYYADSYMPATRTFYLQNKVKLPENISFDPFLNFRIKRANIFVKYQHINYFFASQRTYLSPYYPLQDAAFKFGVTWRFYD